MSAHTPSPATSPRLAPTPTATRWTPSETRWTPTTMPAETLAATPRRPTAPTPTALPTLTTLALLIALATACGTAPEPTPEPTPASSATDAPDGTTTDSPEAPPEAPASAPTSAPSAVPDAAMAVARRAGLDAWPQVARVQFTWHHTGRNLKRTYDWDVVARRVAVTREEVTATLDLNNPTDEDALRAFINDSYWLLFELHLAWDSGTTIARLEADQLDATVPGTAYGLDVRYGQVGPTPGDRYVLLVGADDAPVGWIFYKKGADKPSLVSTRQDHAQQGGLRPPTRFNTPDGQPIIEILDLVITPR